MYIMYFNVANKIYVSFKKYYNIRKNIYFINYILIKDNLKIESF